MARTKIIKRWRRNMEVRDDAGYVDMLTTLSEGSVRRNFNPYTDIDWKSPEFAVVDNDERWILPNSDPLGHHQWYRAQSVERQIEIIGEAARRVSMEFQQAQPDIPWRPIQAQRHVLAHEYGEIKHDRIWRVVTVHIPDLIEQLEPLIPNPPQT